MEMEVLKFIGAGLMAFGALGAALGVGNIFAALLSGLARNPSADEKMSKYFILGAGMVEALGIFALGLAAAIIFA